MTTRDAAIDPAGVFRSIRSDILCGRFVPGQPLSQLELSRAFGVSRSTVREGLRLLEQHGLVAAELNQRVRVRELSAAELDQTYAMLIPLDGLAIQLSAARLSDAQLDRAGDLLDEIDALGARPDAARWVLPHREFHEMLTSAAGDRFTAMINELGDHAACFGAVRTIEDPAVWATSQRQHRSILQACRDGDATTAAARLVEHHGWSALTVLTIADPTFEPVAVRQALRSSGSHHPDGAG